MQHAEAAWDWDLSGVSVRASWWHGLRHASCPGLYAAVDVHYLRSGGAQVVAVVAADAAFSQVIDERTTMVPEVAHYRPGEFYRRELPLLRAVLHGIAGLGLLVIDGYADLDPGGRPGLGAHARPGSSATARAGQGAEV